MPVLRLPPEVEATLSEFYTCEFTTVNRQGQPMTWPSVPYYNKAESNIVCAVSIAFPVKAYNARRHPQVSLLFSDPTGSKPPDPSFVGSEPALSAEKGQALPAVLV